MYDFSDGVLTDATAVANVGWSVPTFQRSSVRILDDHHVVSGGGDVVDLRDGRQVPRGGLAAARTVLCGVGDGCIYVRALPDGDCRRLDLFSGRITEPENPQRWTLPGVRSPSGLRSVQLGPPGGATSYPPRDIWLHEVGAEPCPLGDGFGARMHMLSSSIPTAPLMWLDEERVLTQWTTGDLAVLHLDGTVEPLCKLPTVSEEMLGAIFEGDTGGRFERSPEGGIVYSMMYLDHDRKKLRHHRFLIDPDKGTYQPYGRDWVPLGHGFDHGEGTGWGIAVPLRYRGRTIGSCNEFSARRALAADGHLAVVEDDTLKVWAAATGSWTVVPPAAGERLDSEGVLAWITPERPQSSK